MRFFHVYSGHKVEVIILIDDGKRCKIQRKDGKSKPYWVKKTFIKEEE